MSKKAWIVVLSIALLILLGVSAYIYNMELSRTCGNCGPSSTPSETPTKLIPETEAKIIFLHHSTGQVIWDGGVGDWFDNYNIQNATNFQIAEQVFPKESPYGWNNYPYDYYNIWVKNGDGAEYKTEPTLNTLTKNYDVIIFKHCFPVSEINPDSNANIDSDVKSIENYKLQYNALKEKMRTFKNSKFIVWTGAVETSSLISEAQANRTKEFFDWVKNSWDEKGDNIYIFDFYALETDGGLYLKSGNAVSSSDAHPNEVFAKRVAPIFGQRTVDIIEGKID